MRGFSSPMRVTQEGPDVLSPYCPVRVIVRRNDDKFQKGLGYGEDGTVAKLAMRQPFVLFKGLTFQKLCLPGAFR
ncbi:hypothetical protein AB8R87_27260, partial [Klebsiella pneumoniae subsp. ozaenae]